MKHETNIDWNEISNSFSMIIYMQCTLKQQVLSITAIMRWKKPNFFFKFVPKIVSSSNKSEE